MNKSELLEALSAAQFSLHECLLFLDTHKDDEEALSKSKYYKERYEALKREYEIKYGPLVSRPEFTDGSYSWVKTPFPWEKEAN